MSFQEALKTGRVAEGLIAKWLVSRGASVMPAYEIEVQRFKGPQLFCGRGELVLPDMLAFSPKGILWVEAKHKTVFTWHRITGRWTTGIDLHHYNHYLSVTEITSLPVWLMFYHRESRPDARDSAHGCPPESPTGLFGGELLQLSTSENHRSLPKDSGREGYVGHGNSGMVYWAEQSLKLLATKQEVESAAAAINYSEGGA